VAQSDDAPQPIAIGGEVRRISPASVVALRWLFDHDPATFRELHHELTPRYGQDSFEASILELLRFGFVAIVNACTDPQ
jgi:hypothetical protein